VTGWTRDQLMLMNPSDLLTKKGLGEFSKRMAALERGDFVPETHEYEIKIKDGSSRWAIINTAFKKDKDNKVIGASVVAIDITDRKLAEKEAKEKEDNIFNQLENKIKEWREELNIKSIANELKLQEISLNINSIANSEVQ
jgi:PAS domain S-box-containing protein